MTNPLKGEGRLILEDGRTFTLVLDFDGLIAAEQAYGKPMQQLLAEANQGFMGAIRAILWGALQRHHPQLTLGDAGQLMLDQQQAVMAAVEVAIMAGLPDPGAEGDNPGNASRRPAGRRSGRSGAKRG
jgi:hypothetical protein